MKKIIIRLFTLFMLNCLGLGLAACNKPAGEFKYRRIDDYILIEKYQGSKKTVDIPDEIDGVPVGVLGEYSFYGLDIEAVTIPDSVKTINDEAFGSCKSLKTVIFGKNLEKIGYYAFSDCISLGEALLPDGLTAIVDHAFDGCTALKTVNIPKNLTGWGIYTFANTGITAVNIPDGIKKVPSASFYGCADLEKVTFGKDVEKLSDIAFEKCGALKQLEFSGNAPDISSFSAFDEDADITVYCSKQSFGWDAEDWQGFEIKKK